MRLCFRGLLRAQCLRELPVSLARSVTEEGDVSDPELWAGPPLAITVDY